METFFLVYVLRAECQLYLASELACLILYASTLYLYLSAAGCHGRARDKAYTVCILQIGRHSAAYIICELYSKLSSHARGNVNQREPIAGCISSSRLLRSLSYITGTAGNSALTVTVCCQTYSCHCRVLLPIMYLCPIVHIVLLLYNCCPIGSKTCSTVP